MKYHYRAIYGLRFPSKFKIIKVAHTPIDKQLYVHRWLRGGKACSTQLLQGTLNNLIEPLLVSVFY